MALVLQTLQNNIIIEIKLTRRNTSKMINSNQKMNGKKSSSRNQFKFLSFMTLMYVHLFYFIL